MSFLELLELSLRLGVRTPLVELTWFCSLILGTLPQPYQLSVPL